MYINESDLDLSSMTAEQEYQEIRPVLALIRKQYNDELIADRYKLTADMCRWYRMVVFVRLEEREALRQIGSVSCFLKLKMSVLDFGAVRHEGSSCKRYIYSRWLCSVINLPNTLSALLSDEGCSSSFFSSQWFWLDFVHNKRM